ncbi:protein enabled [Anaeramoeba ignava]|uniref:Protein enabled n=1 Tax=Anaeramoeba ignava TaxID=1746090 RepID=A0A9Q0LNH6_ANAIG|nr:protein enabled [Anaeramoeba ignava]
MTRDEFENELFNLQRGNFESNETKDYFENDEEIEDKKDKKMEEEKIEIEKMEEEKIEIEKMEEEKIEIEKMEEEKIVNFFKEFKWKNNLEENQNQKEKKGKDLIIYTTAENVFLIDFQSKESSVPLAKILKSIPIYHSPQEFRYMHRLSLLEFIPEFSLFIVSSQGAMRVAVFHLIKKFNKNQNKLNYFFIPLKILPDFSIQTTSPVYGISFAKVGSDLFSQIPKFFLYILFQDKSLFVYEISSKLGNSFDFNLF